MFQKLDSLYLNAQSKVKNFVAEERGDVNVVSMVVLIGIAIMLAVLFKGTIGNIAKDLLGDISNQASNVMDPI